MNSNRTKILSTVALVTILFIQLFWMWNTYNINVKKISNDCDRLFEHALEKVGEYRFGEYFKTGESIMVENENPALSLHYTIYEKAHQDAKLKDVYHFTDSLLKRENMPYHFVVQKINMRTGKVLEGEKIGKVALPFLQEAKTSIISVRKDQSVGFQMIVTDTTLYIISQNWILLLITLLTSLVIILSIIDQINYINEQERIKLLREDFSYAMVHDMKSPITSIIMGTRYLHSGVLDNKADIKEKYFRIVEDEAQHLLSLINRLLTISKLEHGKLNICKNTIPLEPMIDDIIDKYKAKASKPITITTHMSCHTVFADEEYLKEAISNLVDNAVKYSKEEIHIDISTSEDSYTTYIRVYDEGIGIAKSELRHIFNRYERAAEHEKNTNKTRGGFGIGLNYVLQVINAHGGKIYVKSEKDKYSEFTIALSKSDRQ